MSTLPSRRAFGGLLGSTAAAATLRAPSAAAAERPFRAAPERDSTRPNLLVILADDLGWADLTCFGSPTINTPRLDRLARQGVRFTQAYAGSSTCSPTRFALYTGRFPGRVPGGLAEPIADSTVGLEPGHPTLASLLRDAGYDTALIGKWHCGYLPDYSPTRSGWNSFFGNLGGALEYYSKLGLNGEYDLYEGDATYQDLRYYTRVLTERAVEHVGTREAGTPWLLNLNFTTPHWPWIAEGDEEVGTEIARRLQDGEPHALFHYDGGSLEKYAEMVEDLDRSVGLVLDALAASGQERDTLVFFGSDNGGERWSHQWPLSGEKASLQEGGIRIPQIVRWPARLDGGQVSHLPHYSPDWTATLLELAGTRPDAGHPLDGHSLAGYLLRDEAPPERDLFWRVRAERALRRGDWKYHRDDEGLEHLYNLEEDPRERADRATTEPELFAALRDTWEAIDTGLLPYPD